MAERQDVWASSDAYVPFPDGVFDTVVCGLVLNFVPDRRRALGEMKAGGTVAAYVWDYAGEMPLAELFRQGGLGGVEARAIDVPTVFRDFDDSWAPFLGGQAPAPGYCMSLTEERRAALRERIRASLPVAADGRIRLVARAWAVRSLNPEM